MSLETYLKRTVKPNDIPYVKQAIKEWLTQKHQVEHSNMDSSIIHWNAVINELLKELEK